MPCLTRHATTLSQLPELLEILLAHLPDELRQPRIELTFRQCEQESCQESNAQTRTQYEIFHFERDGQMIGGAFSMLRPDGTLLSLQPVVAPTEPETTLRLIYERLIDFAVVEHALLVMVLVDCQQSADEVVLGRYGFEKISELLNLNAERTVFPTHCPADRLSFRPYRDEQWDIMVALVEKTYKNTLDFPRLTGYVPTEYILHGYQENHIFDPALWFFIEFQSRTIGALLLTQMDHSNHLELTYLGLAEEFRGRGFSREIVQFSQYIAGRKKKSHLLVAVDAANIPALNTYLHCHFQLHDQKEIYVRFLHV
ncbi:MAG: GNAT family N-acetyltransferase [Planctomycetaceae bacterium]|nr:GNAT family N-acetyltransferase [Planctomycetaceae bacterium]